MEDNMTKIQGCNDEDGPYIEIELDHAVSTKIHNDYDDNKNNCIDDDDGDDEYKLRISISSTISVSLQKESINDEIGASQATMLSLQHSGVSHINEVEFPWESPQLDSQTTILGTSTTRVIPYDHVNVLYARKQPSMTTTGNGIMMKLLIKFRGLKIRSIFASLIKPRQNNSSKKSITFFQCYQRGLVNPSNGSNSKHWNMENDSICGSLRKSKTLSRVMEMDLGGIFNGMGMSRRSKRRTCGSSTSCNNSPFHEGFSKENSIQAAIAYCKSSFGQTSDFTFTSSISSTP